MTYRDVVNQVLEELGVLGQGETASAGDSIAALVRVNRVLDSWNADEQAAYSETLIQNILTPGLQPHTLGPTGATWTVSQRPVAIQDAQLFVGTVTYDLTIRTADWYADLPVPALQSMIPTDLFYNPTWPNGACYFWPVPLAAYTVQLLVHSVLGSSATLNDTLVLPPGYQQALILTAAEECFAAFGTPLENRPFISQRASDARARIFAANLMTPPMATRDVGLPGKRGWFNWRTGLNG